MCGIIGITGSRQAPPLLVEGLKQLEYRGYDSAGIAVVHHQQIARARAQGKLINLEAQLEKSSVSGTTGIGHTRWATHGVPSEANAHPHATAKVAVVHNGIIENFRELRDELTKAGYSFTSQTDTEVVPVLVTAYMDKGASAQEAVFKTVARLEGAFAIAFVLIRW